MKLLVLCMLCAVDSIAIPSFFQNVSFRDYKALVPVVCTYELSVVTGVMAFKHSKDAVNDTLFNCNKKQLQLCKDMGEYNILQECVQLIPGGNVVNQNNFVQVQKYLDL